MTTKKAFVIESCKNCPNRRVTRGPGGYSEDWYCHTESISFYGPIPKEAKKIGGYIEYPSDEPKGIPEWCPLPDAVEEE